MKAAGNGQGELKPRFLNGVQHDTQIVSLEMINWIHIVEL